MTNEMKSRSFLEINNTLLEKGINILDYFDLKIVLQPVQSGILAKLGDFHHKWHNLLKTRGLSDIG